MFVNPSSLRGIRLPPHEAEKLIREIHNFTEEHARCVIAAVERDLEYYLHSIPIGSGVEAARRKGIGVISEIRELAVARLKSEEERHVYRPMPMEYPSSKHIDSSKLEELKSMFSTDLISPAMKGKFLDDLLKKPVETSGLSPEAYFEPALQRFVEKLRNEGHTIRVTEMQQTSHELAAHEIIWKFRLDNYEVSVKEVLTERDVDALFRKRRDKVSGKVEAEEESEFMKELKGIK